VEEVSAQNQAVNLPGSAKGQKAIAIGRIRLAAAVQVGYNHRHTVSQINHAPQ